MQANVFSPGGLVTYLLENSLSEGMMSVTAWVKVWATRFKGPERGIQ